MTKFRASILAASALMIFLASGCSSWQSGIERLAADVTNKGATVSCYSGGELIYQSRTEVKPISEPSSDGYYFRNSETNHFVEISADCVFVYDN